VDSTKPKKVKKKSYNFPDWVDYYQIYSTRRKEQRNENPIIFQTGFRVCYQRYPPRRKGGTILDKRNYALAPSTNICVKFSITSVIVSKTYSYLKCLHVYSWLVDLSAN
jgi:hypothetical protein